METTKSKIIEILEEKLSLKTSHTTGSIDVQYISFESIEESAEAIEELLKSNPVIMEAVEKAIEVLHKIKQISGKDPSRLIKSGVLAEEAVALLQGQKEKSTCR